MSYTHLSREERYQIYALKQAGHKQSEIAHVLERSASTISRELARNHRGQRGYRPKQAHGMAQARRAMNARTIDEATVAIWGAGTPQREFMHSDDMADANVSLMNLPEERFVPTLGQDRDNGLPTILDIVVGWGVCLKELAETVRNVVDYAGEIVFDSTKPDWTPRKLLDVSRLQRLSWNIGTGLRGGLAAVYADFLHQLHEECY